MTEAPALATDMALQVELLLYSLLVGVSLGALFDLLRFTRIFVCFPFIKKGGRCAASARFAADLCGDILFFTLSAAVLVIFCFRTNRGDARAFMLISLTLGFFAYIFTFGKLTPTLWRAVTKLVYGAVGGILNSIIMPILRFFARLASRIYKIGPERLVTRLVGYARRYRAARGEVRRTRREAALRGGEEGSDNESGTDIHTG